MSLKYTSPKIFVPESFGSSKPIQTKPTPQIEIERVKADYTANKEYNEELDKMEFPL